MSAPIDSLHGAPSLAWGGRRFWLGVWRVTDPKITLASVASLFLGTAAAARDGVLHLGYLAFTILGIFLLEAAKNMSGELFDWDSGTDQRVAPEDRSPFSGGKRVLVDGLMTRGQTIGVAFVLYALAGAVGLVVTLHEPRVLWLGLGGAAIAFFYHAPPFKLAYRGLGELAVMLAYGPMILCGAYLVQRGTVAPWLLHLAMPLGLMISAFLFVNEMPDARADAESGKRTLVVRLGKDRASRAFALFPLVAFGYLLALPAIAPVGPGVWLGFVGLPLAAVAAIRVRRHHACTADLVPAQGFTLLSFVLLALGGGVGLLLF
jgi:1,4-dihydroxy-2-naphthoate polyprenyltransferase